jgi:hypothetical protein
LVILAFLDQFLDQRAHLARFGVATVLQLGVNERAINSNLICPAFGGDEADALDKPFVLVQQFSRQTGGARGVVSNCTVFDGDNHDSSPKFCGCYYNVFKELKIANREKTRCRKSKQ